MDSSYPCTQAIIDHIRRYAYRYPPTLYPLRIWGVDPVPPEELFRAFFIQNRVPDGVSVAHMPVVRAQMACDALIGKVISELTRGDMKLRYEYKAVIPFWYERIPVMIYAVDAAGERRGDVVGGRAFRWVSDFKVWTDEPDLVERHLDRAYRDIFDFIVRMEGIDTLEHATRSAMEAGA